MDELYVVKSEEAKKELLSLQGIREFSAELVMPKTGSPLDIWSAKIFSEFFNSKVPETLEKPFLFSKQLQKNYWEIGENTRLSIS